MILPLAHMGHWLMGIGFAGPPLTIIGGVVAMAIRERRREARDPHTPHGSHEPA